MTNTKKQQIISEIFLDTMIETVSSEEDRNGIEETQ
jgi:hypothetical protein